MKTPKRRFISLVVMCLCKSYSTDFLNFFVTRLSLAAFGKERQLLQEHSFLYVCNSVLPHSSLSHKAINSNNKKCRFYYSCTSNILSLRYSLYLKPGDNTQGSCLLKFFSLLTIAEETCSTV